MLQRNMLPDEAAMVGTAGKRSPGEQQVSIVLKPVSHPQLGDIRIEENLFAIGRTEPPFASYAPEVTADLSRRHARIFSEYGAVYIADIESKNGTTVNGIGVQQKITRLRDGDEICFGRTLSYRVQINTRAIQPKRVPQLAGLILTPVRDDLGLQPIAITQFPFLISKADQVFTRYRETYPHQVNYLSRRHAHIFLKGDVPFVEDLGSTNGTFVAGNRLDEHAVALEEGTRLAFGGHHFVYQVSLQKSDEVATQNDPTLTKLSVVTARGSQSAADADKTTFVASAGSFLDIFCVKQEQSRDDEINNEGAQPDDAKSGTGKQTDKRRNAGKLTSFLSELIGALNVGGREQVNRLYRWGMAIAIAAVALGAVLYFNGATERELKDLIASGDFAQAAALASRSLESDSDNAEIKALGTEALLKADVPKWMDFLKRRDFGRAAVTIGEMRKLSSHNPDAQPFVTELDWMGSLEQFVNARGGADLAAKNPADAERIKTFVKHWNDDMQAHQRTFITISTYVPEFRDAYAEALSHLRKLELAGSQNGNERQPS